jgi:D-serine deaminase-like pyridoxal phosphate-dependent protein
MSTPTPSETKPDLYAPVSEIETPAVLVDLDVMEANVDRYAAMAADNGVRLRSHAKTHKVPELAHRQHERSDGGGILCQKLGEAEVMAASGLDDIYLSYQVVGDRKLDRLVRLSETADEFATTVDGLGNVDPLQAAAARRDATVGAILEVDVGLGRTGVAPGEPAVELAEEIAERPNLAFEGIMAYEAHVKGAAETEADYERLCHEAMETAARTVDLIEDAGVPVDEVKVGGTATSPYSSRHPVATEINPGQYAFNDVGEIEARPWAVEKVDCALTVLSTVVSTQVDDQVIVDAGSKSLSMDTDRLPLPKRRDDLAYAGYSEEHGHVDTSECGIDLEVGDRLEFVAPHVCPTINLHDTLVGVRDGVVEAVWSVQARGKVK